MGGDHKCPVCQATFTRPQHVARHMRSHTGDRPYKCQYCGDQFARSDLLSRHVNKCHANEKPVAGGSATGRRKGSTSLSRATTSKQSCDQCVQGSLPCDGCNPCGKCIQRKYRCTYVKFHRQTAPVGPGHNPASSSTGATSSTSPLTSSARPTTSGGLSGLPSLTGLPGHPTLSGTHPDLSSTSTHTGMFGGPHFAQSQQHQMGMGSLPTIALPTSGLNPAVYGGSTATSSLDDLYHLPPPHGYAASSSHSADPASLYGAPGAVSSSSSSAAHAHGGYRDTEDMYGSTFRLGRGEHRDDLDAMDTAVYGSTRPGTASSGGSSSASGHGGHVVQGTTANVHGWPAPSGTPASGYHGSAAGGYGERLESRVAHTLQQGQQAQWGGRYSRGEGLRGSDSLGPRGSDVLGSREGVGVGGSTSGVGVGGTSGYHPHDLQDDGLSVQAHSFRELFAEEFSSPTTRTRGLGRAEGFGTGGDPRHGVDTPPYHNPQTQPYQHSQQQQQQYTTHQRKGSATGSGHSSDGGGGGAPGGASDVGHTVEGGRGHRKYVDSQPPTSATTASEPYAYQYHARIGGGGGFGRGRLRAESAASLASRSGSASGGSMEPSPLMTGQNLAPMSQPTSATTSVFSSAFGSMSLDDATIASLVAEGRLLSAQAQQQQQQQTTLNPNDPDATPLGMPTRGSASLSKYERDVQQQQQQQQYGKDSLSASPIQRPLSSLAAFPPSSYSNLLWHTAGTDEPGGSEGDYTRSGGGQVGGGGQGGGGALGGWDDSTVGLEGDGGNSGSGSGWMPVIAADGTFTFDPSTGGTQGGEVSSAFPATPSGKEGDMKDVWRMYMRTPLSGPGYDSSVGGGTNAGSSGSGGGPVTGGSGPVGHVGGGWGAAEDPSGGSPMGFRRTRVSSFPSSSNAKLTRDGAVAHLSKTRFGSGLGPMSSLRTTLHGVTGYDKHNQRKDKVQCEVLRGGGEGSAAESSASPYNDQDDLSSYGAAVLARKAPVNLSLERVLGRVRQQQQLQDHQEMQEGRGESYQSGFSGALRTGSSGSSSMSESRGSSMVRDGCVAGDIQMGSAAETESAVGGGGGVVASGRGGEQTVRTRPSVKRLASSVLESDVHKVGRFVTEGDDTPRGPTITQDTEGMDAAAPLMVHSTEPLTIVAPKPSAPFRIPPAVCPAQSTLSQHPLDTAAPTITIGGEAGSNAATTTLSLDNAMGGTSMMLRVPPPVLSTSAPPPPHSDSGMSLPSSVMGARPSTVMGGGGMSLLERRQGRVVDSGQ